MVFMSPKGGVGAEIPDNPKLEVLGCRDIESIRWACRGIKSKRVVWRL
jgi:hypothetical protein